MRVRVQRVTSLDWWGTVCVNKLHTSLLTSRDRTCHFTIFRVKQNNRKTICTKHFYFLFMKCFINDNKMTFILGTLSIYQNVPRKIKFQLSISSQGPEGNPVLLLVLSFQGLSLYGGGVSDQQGNDAQCILTLGDAQFKCRGVHLTLSL